MLFSQIPKLKMFLKLAHLISIYTIWAAILVTPDNTKFTLISNHLDGSVRVSDNSQDDEFDIFTRVHENVVYICTTD